MGNEVTPTHWLHVDDHDFHGVLGGQVSAIALRGCPVVSLGPVGITMDNTDDPGYPAEVVTVTHTLAARILLHHANKMGFATPLDAFTDLWRRWHITPITELTIVEFASSHG